MLVRKLIKNLNKILNNTTDLGSWKTECETVIFKKKH